MIDKTRILTAAILVSILLLAPITTQAHEPLHEIETLETNANDLDLLRTLLHEQDETAAALDPSLEPLLEQRHRNLDTLEALLTIHEAEQESDFARGITIAKEGTQWQTATLGLQWTDPIPLIGYETPSEALHELAARYDTQLTKDQHDELLALDDLPAPLPLALARFVDAFLAMNTATAMAYSEADHNMLQKMQERLEDPDAFPTAFANPGALLKQAGIDLTPVFPTRNQFLDTIGDLRQALDESGPIVLKTSAPISVAPVFSIDLGSASNTYTQDYALMFDNGGRDQYHNNAGGGSTLTQVATAALIDWGHADDEYGNPASPRNIGVNGGGYQGTGFLFDESGPDTYTATNAGTNGGGAGGVGFLADLAGDDTYTATSSGTNGGSNLGGVGFLADLAGDDTYAATFYGTNGGGAGGMGFLTDLAGDDKYTAASGGANGGSSGGVGFLADLAGNDAYTATSQGTNGGGIFGVGFLADLAGNDAYTATDRGTNGGAYEGAGFLTDVAGNDTYTATHSGANGGGQLGMGALFDGGDTDHYEDALVNCWDCSMTPKGIAGSQQDHTAPKFTHRILSVQKIADLGVSGTPTATIIIESGTLRTWIGTNYADLPLIIPRANGLPDPETLELNMPPVSTAYTVDEACYQIAGTCQLTLGLQAGDDFVKVGEIWESRIDILIDGEVVASSPYVEVRT